MIKPNNRFRNSALLIMLATVVLAMTTGCASQKPVEQDLPKGAAAGKQITEVIATEDAESYLVVVKGPDEGGAEPQRRGLQVHVLWACPTSMCTYLRPRSPYFPVVRAYTAVSTIVSASITKRRVPALRLRSTRRTRER